MKKTGAERAITLGQVRMWIAEAAPRWPILDDSELIPIVNACRCEQQRIAHEVHASNQAELRRELQALRTAADVLIEELPKLIARVGEWGAEDARRVLKGSTEVRSKAPPSCVHDQWTDLQSAYRAIRAIRPYLIPIRAAGGQSKPWNAFAFQIACHLRGCLEKRGKEVSFKAEGPGVKFLIKAVFAAYDDLVSSVALASALRRAAAL